MNDLLTITFNTSLVLHTVLIVVVVWRIWRGKTIVDRLIGVELMATLLMAILVILGLLNRDSIYLNIAIALAALGFVTTIALAKYLADEQLF
ncbi:MAG: monovalent cation/H+ antiporter complex subunit F [Chloroflexota bacterium]|jgi:multicomponent Na+:H+ antiporter subunit F